MLPFARLIDGLIFAPQRNAKLRLIADYLRSVPDPDRGWALAALTGALSFTAIKAGTIRGLIEARMDPVLFGWSYDFVGDLAETVALTWPEPADPAAAQDDPSLTQVVELLASTGRAHAPQVLAQLLDTVPAEARYAVLKLITGALRVGVSARLAKLAVAELAVSHGQPLTIEDIEEIWPALEPPYEGLFAWVEGRSGRPQARLSLTFRPLMLSQPVDEADFPGLDAAAYRAEWKWDGIRTQIAAGADGVRLHSRTGEDISGAFPDIAAACRFDAVLDGELLVARGGKVAPFNDLQQRLNRKKLTQATLDDYPAFVRLYDILEDAGEDLRALPFDARRLRLEAWFAREKPARMDISPLIPFAGWEDLAAQRAAIDDPVVEGVMLKRGDSAYVSGRPKGPWFKWKRDPFLVDCVLMYAQRGHGKRSSFYSDFTFGCWLDDPSGGTRQLTPVGKAYFGFTDEELRQLDSWVRNHTGERYGPVRAVEQKLVLEVAFDSVAPSTRHRSGYAMRFPRIARIRWDKPADEADTVETLAKLVAVTRLAG